MFLLMAVTYYLGYTQGWRTQKRTDTEFNIHRALRVLHYAEAGDLTNIVKSSRMYLYGHTRAYQTLVPDKHVKESFRPTLIEAQRVAEQVKTNLVPITRKTFEQ